MIGFVPKSRSMSPRIVSFAAVFWDDACVTSQKTPAKETSPRKAHTKMIATR